MFRYFAAIAAALVAFSMIQLAIVPVIELGHSLVSQGAQRAEVFSLFVAFLDWAACIACVVLGVALAPSRKLSVAVGLSLGLACWHLAQILVIISFAGAIGTGIVPLSIIYYGGLIVTGALCCLVYEQVAGRHDIVHSRALAAISGPSVYKQALDGVTPNMTPLETGFFDFDLILLEDELLKIKPDRDAYISALRLGMAIERDCGYVNCRARASTFAELMRDVSMRLSATCDNEHEWMSLANGFRLYKFDEVAERKGRLASLEEMLQDGKYKPQDGPAARAVWSDTIAATGQEQDHPTREIAALILH